MDSMVFNIVKVERVEPGAELDGTVYDQWLHIEYGGVRASVFDPMMIAPDHAVGEFHEVKLSVMATSIEPAGGRMLGINGNTLVGKVVAVRGSPDLYVHLLDVNGLKIHLLENRQYPLGEVLLVRGRLDLDDIQYPSPSPWEPAQPR